MDFGNIEHWVLKSMKEAQVSLEHGEVPVGCLFIIQREKLNNIMQREEINPENIYENKSIEIIQREKLNNIMQREEINHENIYKNKSIEIVAGSSTNNTAEAQNHKTRDLLLTEPRIIEDASGGFIVIARGKNQVNATKNATRHAEMVCIDQIVQAFSKSYTTVFENITVVVNVEPCIMCMAALLQLNIRNIVFTCINDRFGYNILGERGRTNYIEIVERDTETGDVKPMHHEDKIAQHPIEKIDNVKETKLLNQDLNLEDRHKLRKYKVSFMNKDLVASEDEVISDKISSLVGQQMYLCNVFHHRKYESDTMNILKLFYKGVNPNAPKHKVKIR